MDDDGLAGLLIRMEREVWVLSPTREANWLREHRTELLEALGGERGGSYESVFGPSTAPRRQWTFPDD